MNKIKCFFRKFHIKGTNGICLDKIKKDTADDYFEKVSIQFNLQTRLNSIFTGLKQCVPNATKVIFDCYFVHRNSSKFFIELKKDIEEVLQSEIIMNINFSAYSSEGFSKVMKTLNAKLIDENIFQWTSEGKGKKSMIIKHKK